MLRGAAPYARGIGALLDDGHVGPQGKQPVELQAERHVAVPGHDAEFVRDLWYGIPIG